MTIHWKRVGVFLVLFGLVVLLGWLLDSSWIEIMLGFALGFSMPPLITFNPR